jgi:integrase
MIFRFAVKKRLVSFNPVGDSTCPEKLINGKSQVRDPLTKEEWLEYLSFFRKTELDTFVHIAALLGLRRSEIVGLDWEDIDFENKVLHVRKSARECTTYRPDGSSKTELAIYNPKTKHSKRKLPLEPVLIDALKRQKRNQITQKLVAGDSWQGSNALFTTKYGTRIFPSNISKRYRKLIAESQLRYVRIHDLRHTVASLLLENEMPVEEVSRLLGHSNIEITVNIYGSRVQALADRGALGMSKLYEEAKPRNAYFKKAEAL